MIYTANVYASEETSRLIELGLAEPRGGVVYWTNASGHHGIIEHLSEVTEANATDTITHNSIEASIIPSVVMCVSMLSIQQRLAAIESKLEELHGEVSRISDQTEMLQLKHDAHVLGRLRGQMEACAYDLQEGRLERLSAYREKFLSAYRELEAVCRGIMADTALFKKFPLMLQNYYQGMILAGIAARDVSYQMNEEKTASSLARQVQEDVESIASKLAICIRQPSWLFWQDVSHLRVAKVIKDGSTRIAQHAAMLATLPRETLARLASA